ncbi:MAG: hypothetical protein RBG13Loki_1867 [Promethearchaeota archaeon CR_4]|nr:MAG: hypothetical protein RBG13Loki_1867 [Candidatus Lokiarchaeota archaeon CR_4]
MSALGGFNRKVLKFAIFTSFMENEPPAAFDLNNAIGKRVLLKLKSHGVQFAGILERFDQHLNLYLREAVETSRSGQKNHPHVILRGDTISMICI